MILLFACKASNGRGRSTSCPAVLSRARGRRTSCTTIVFIIASVARFVVTHAAGPINPLRGRGWIRAAAQKPQHFLPFVRRDGNRVFVRTRVKSFQTRDNLVFELWPRL